MRLARRVITLIVLASPFLAGQVDSLFRAGTRLLSEGRTAEGVGMLIRARADSGDAYARSLLGMGYAALNDMPSARRFLAEAMALDSGNAAYRFQYARFLHQNLVLTEAAEQYRAVLAQDSTFAAAWFQLGLVSKLLGSPDSVTREYFAATLRYSPEDYLAHFYLGTALLNDSTTAPEGLTHLQAALARNPSFVPVLERLASYHYGRHEDIMAAQYYARAVGLRPLNPELRFYLGEVYRRSKLLDSAFIHLKAAVALDTMKALYRGQLGYAFFQSKQYDSAVSAYQKAIELEPENIQFYQNLALVFNGLDSVEGAAEAYRGAIRQLSPESLSDFYMMLGHAYFRGHRYTEAREAYQRALDVTPNHRESIFYLALTADQNDEYAVALRYYKRSLALIQHDSTMAARKYLVESRIKYLETKTANSK